MLKFYLQCWDIFITSVENNKGTTSANLILAFILKLLYTQHKDIYIDYYKIVCDIMRKHLIQGQINLPFLLTT